MPDVFSYRLQVIRSGDDFATGPSDIDVILTVDPPVTQFQAIVALAEGGYQWRVIAEDRATNKASSVTQSFLVDTLGPITPGELEDVTIVRTADVRTFEWVRSRDPGFRASGEPANTGSGVVFYNVVITGPVDLDVRTGDSSICTGDTCTFITPELIPGLYNIRVTAEDRAANTSDAATIPFTSGRLSLVQGLKLLDKVPELVNTVNTRNPRFQWKPPAEPAFVVTTYEVATGDFPGLPFTGDDFKDFKNPDFFIAVCSRAGGSIDCSGATISGDRIQIRLVATLADGSYRLAVRAAGTADTGAAVKGNPVQITFSVDATPPSAPQLVFPGSGDFINDNTPLFDWEASTDTEGVVEYRLRVTSGDIITGPFDVDVVVTGDPPVNQFQVATADALADAIYAWRVVARDGATNTASSATRTFTLDTSPPSVGPELVAPGDAALFNTRIVDFKWNGSGSADILSYRLQITSGDINSGPFDVDKEIFDPITGDQITLPEEDGEWVPRTLPATRHPPTFWWSGSSPWTRVHHLSGRNWWLPKMVDCSTTGQWTSNGSPRRAQISSATGSRLPSVT